MTQTALIEVPGANAGGPRAPRTAEVARNTAETRIHVKVNLDGSGHSRLSTGIGFFDHMLDQIARHGLIDLDIEAEGDLRIKVNPLAHWGREDIEDYMVNNRLPRHPLVAKGYPSIGCAPCTTPVKEGEDPRAGRWRNSEKTECGIHFVNGIATRPYQEPTV